MKSYIFMLFVVISSTVFSQNIEDNKCGNINSGYIESKSVKSVYNWGYGYNDLLQDLQKWDRSPYVKIKSIGKSVQDRDLWELEITSFEDTVSDKHKVYFHVRTHPNEVQSFWVANEIINLLLSDDSLAVKTRENCVFYMVPMYNPDGVELEYARQNANHIDLESNWYSTNNIQPEVMALRNRFLELMATNNPIEIALNLHSAYKCKRYFVVHHQNGTDNIYLQMEKRFVEGVRNYFPDGIEPWNFFVTWKNGNPLKYPESWWWANYGRTVLALTYEDGNCDEAGKFDKTAYAIVNGITDYLKITNSTGIEELTKPNNIVVYPNPVKDNLTIDFSGISTGKIEIIDALGRNIFSKSFVNERSMNIDFSHIKQGIYYIKIIDSVDSIYSVKHISRVK